MTIKTSLTPLGYRVLIKPDEVQKKSEGGIIIQTDERRARASIHTGVVVKIGETAWNQLDDKKWVEVEDYVLFSKYGGKTVYDPESDEEFIIVNDEDVLCKIDSKKTVKVTE